MLKAEPSRSLQRWLRARRCTAHGAPRPSYLRPPQTPFSPSLELSRLLPITSRAPAPLPLSVLGIEPSAATSGH